MDNMVEFPDREMIEQEAAQWLVRLDNDKLLDPAELQSFKDWINRSPLHREELIGLSEFWSGQSLAALPIRLEQLCYETSARHESEPERSWSLGRWASVAALLFVGLCIALVSGTHWLPGATQPSDFSTALYATAVGQQRTLTLPDGSMISLNTNSQVKVDYNHEYRNIQLLQGEAHFDVAKQPGRPFRVYAGRGRVQAVGTAFTVYFRSNDDVDVAVTEGTVALAVLTESDIADKKSLTSATETSIPSEEPIPKSSELYLKFPVDELGVLEAGQATTILVADKSQVEAGKKLDGVKNITQEELVRRSAWRSGLLVFSGHSLEEVVKEMGRYTTLSIEIVDPELKTVRIGGRFSMDSTTALFNALEANFGLRVTQLDYNRVQISSGKK
jgi:transmembrane sensor